MLETDLTTAAGFMYESQIQQATNRFMYLNWPNESAQITLYEASMRQMFQDQSSEMYKITNDAGEMIANMILTRKTHSKEEPTTAPANQTPIDLTALNPAVRPVMRNALIGVQQSMEGIDHIGKNCNALLRASMVTFEISSLHYFREAGRSAEWFRHNTGRIVYRTRG